MAKKSAKAPGPIYQLKVTLNGTRPPIWRRLLVPASLTLGDLHHVIQVAMGWTDSHLHDFFAGEKRYGPAHPELEETLDEERAKLGKLIPGEKFKFRYEYDFGDSWIHTVEVEKILDPEPGKSYPVCLKGKGACPPEDCGGVWGFADFLAAIADPGHPEHDHFKEWSGGDYDPDAFDLAEVNRVLAGEG